MRGVQSDERGRAIVDGFTGEDGAGVAIHIPRARGVAVRMCQSILAGSLSRDLISRPCYVGAELDPRRPLALLDAGPDRAAVSSLYLTFAGLDWWRLSKEAQAIV